MSVVMIPTLEMIKQLRAETGAGVMECRKALQQSDSDFEKALVSLQEKAAIKAAKRAGQETREGKIELYSHNNGRIGVMIEINTETDFARRSDIFDNLGRGLALQITAAAPRYVRDEDIPQQELDEQARAAAEKARAAGKPERFIPQIVDGVLEKYKNSHVLLRQLYIRDENITVAQLVNRAIGQIGENIVVRRFVRWEICPDEEVCASA